MIDRLVCLPQKNKARIFLSTRKCRMQLCFIQLFGLGHKVVRDIRGTRDSVGPVGRVGRIGRIVGLEAGLKLGFSSSYKGPGRRGLILRTEIK